MSDLLAYAEGNLPGWLHAGSAGGWLEVGPCRAYSGELGCSASFSVRPESEVNAVYRFAMGVWVKVKVTSTHVWMSYIVSSTSYPYLSRDLVTYANVNVEELGYAVSDVVELMSAACKPYGEMFDASESMASSFLSDFLVVVEMMAEEFGFHVHSDSGSEK